MALLLHLKRNVYVYVSNKAYACAYRKKQEISTEKRKEGFGK